MKIGIIGNGSIVLAALSAFQEAGIEVCALWCRNGEKGKPLQEQFGFEKLYTDYDAFLADDSFDTVYVGLVNSLHYSYTIKALRCGKHAIVEKPFTITHAEAKDLVDTAKENGVYVFEAIMSRYSQNLEKVREGIEQLGEVLFVQAVYAQYSRRYDAYREGKVMSAFDPRLSGEALYDLNIYNIHMMTALFGMPKKAEYIPFKGFNGVDLGGTLVLAYPGFQAALLADKHAAGKSGIVIAGKRGYLELPGRPGMIRKIVTCFDGEEDQIECIQEGNPMTQEFRLIARVVDEKDEAQVDAWMEQSLQSAYILDEARKSGGLVFAIDKE